MGSSFSQPQQDVARLLKATEAGQKKDVLRLIAGNPLLAATPSGSSGRTLWHAAAQYGWSDLIAAIAAHIQLLWDGQLRESIAFQENSSTHGTSALPESNQVLAYLVNFTDRKGRTPLILACISGSVQGVEVLLGLGANPRIGVPMGKLALHYAAQHGHTRQVLQLLQWWQHQQQHSVESNSAFLDAATCHGVTPLHLAVLRCHPGTVKVLLEHGASVTKTCTYPRKGPRWLTHKHDGCTALHLAAATGSKSITCLLLAAHFQGGRVVEEQDPRALRNYQGRLAVDIALGRGYRRVAEVLEPSAPLSTFMSRRELGLTPIPMLVQLAGQALQQKLLLELELVEANLKLQGKKKRDAEVQLLPPLDDGTKHDVVATIRKSLPFETTSFHSPLQSFDHSLITASLTPTTNTSPPTQVASQFSADSELAESTSLISLEPLQTLSSHAALPVLDAMLPTQAAEARTARSDHTARSEAATSEAPPEVLEASSSSLEPDSEPLLSRRLCSRRFRGCRNHSGCPDAASSTQQTNSLEDDTLLLTDLTLSTVPAGPVLLVENPHAAGLAGGSADESDLDNLDEEPACCEASKPQTDPVAPSTSSLLSSASHLIGGTLRKALGGGHHRSRSGNGSQGGGPLSIIASMALASEPGNGGGGLCPGTGPEGWSPSSLVDWAASTSAATLPPAHAALLALQLDDDDDVCEVCMDHPPEVTIANCQHKLCVECCRSVLKMRDMCAPLCPFCRGQIEGLQ